MSHQEKQQQTNSYSRKWQLPLLEEQWPWAEVFNTQETFRGRYFFLYSVNEEEPTFGLPGLTHILPIADRGLYRSPLLVPTEERLSQFGLLAVSPKTNIHLEQPSMQIETMLSARWLFAVEWVSDMSAWDALLFTFDHLDPVIIGLKPSLVFSTLFVARMAEHPQASVFETIQAWAPLLDDTQERLLALILALYLHWLEGPSLAAKKLQAMSQDSDPLDEESMTIFDGVLRAFERIAGTARLDAFLHAERLVPAALRLLDEVSWSLWKPTIPMNKQHDAVLSTHTVLLALLPIALWHPEAFLTLNLSINQDLSLESLHTIWQSRRALTEKREENPKKRWKRLCKQIDK
jgi:hypothetical protein